MNNSHSAMLQSPIYKLLKCLVDDVNHARKTVEQEDSPFSRRTYARALFAAIEGMVFLFKKRTLWQVFANIQANLRQGKEGKIDPGLISLLADQEYSLDDRGGIKAKRALLRAASNLQFTLHETARAMGLEYSLDRNSPGWDAYQKGLKIRDRITHPKEDEDMDIADKELEILDRSLQWFLGETGRVIGISNQEPT